MTARGRRSPATRAVPRPLGYYLVEIGFMGNVVREFYRISLVDGKAWDATSGRPVVFGK